MKILLVEDNPGDVCLIKDYLRESQIKIQSIKHVICLMDAIEILQREIFDLILLDIGLPDSNGIETFQKIFQINYNIPIIVLTGLHDEETSVKAVGMGAQDYLIKGDINSYILQKSIKYAIERKRAEEELIKSRELYQGVFENTGTATMIIDEDTIILYANKECFSVTGYTEEQLVGTSWTKYIAPENQNMMIQYHIKRRHEATNLPNRYETRLINAKGEEKIAMLSVGLIPYTKQSVVSMLDITENKKFENELQISKERLKLAANILNILNHFIDKKSTLQNILSLIKDFTGFDAVGIRLKDGEDYPYYIIDGFPDEFVEKERSLCTYNNNGHIIKDKTGKPFLECLCGNIISGRTCPELPFFTIGGSFWTNSTTDFIKNTTEEELHTHIRNRCISAGYESLALIPIKIDKQTIGLLQLNNKRKNMLSADLVSFFEELCMSIGIALARSDFEKSLIESEQRYRDLADSLSLGIYETDLEKKITFANQTAFDWFGYKKEDLSNNLKIDQFLSNIDLKRAEENFKKVVLTGQTSSGEYNVIKKDGKSSDTIVTCCPIIKDGRTIGIRGIIYDITEHKKSKEKIKIFSSAVENAYDCFIFTDLDRNITYVNKNTNKVFGYTEDELLKMNSRQLNANKEASRMINKAISKEGKWSGEVTCIKKNNKKFPVLLSLSIVNNENGQPIAMMGVSRDITESKQSEKLLIEKEAAEAASRAKSEFLANMSHEIRTPMNAIIGFSDLLYAEIKDEKQRSQIDSIRTSGKNLLGIINDILDLSKIEADKMSLQYEPVNLISIIKDIENIFIQNINQKGLLFKIEIDKDFPYALILDEIRIRQILFNLIGNAVKFTEKGHIILRINKIIKNKNIIDLIVSIEDTGIGISKDQQELIFETFGQQKGQNTKKYGGTGLGLTISKRLVEMMGGKIYVYSEPEKGSVFKFVVPDVEVSTNEIVYTKEKTFDISTLIFEKAKLLIVDDVESNRKLITDILENSNLNIYEAQNGQQALDLAMQFLPDLILMDLKMPIMNGYDATKVLKNAEATKSIPVIAISASSKLILHDDESKSIFDDYLMKPINITELTDLLKKYLKYNVNEHILHNEEKILPEIELSGAQKRKLPELISELETEYTEYYKELVLNQRSDKILTFSQKLSSLGEKYSLNILIKYGNQLESSLKSFDVELILKNINKFPDLVKSIKNIINYKS
ncbi:MAG: PAS domain S-box protein [Bacteroidota bacterium]|nr:PAS domain S-box protein [Bacteroidota bacterium]